MSTLRTALTGYTRYQGRTGQWIFLLHRLTGLGTLLFLAIHILDTSTVFFFPNLYQQAIDLYRSTLFGILEVGLIFCVFFHGVNGLRVAILDLFAPKGWNLLSQKQLTLWTLAITLVLWVPSTVIMLRNLLINNFGLFGGG
jgi:succinate dehydrogenase / fumarate reductase cytochrome b subunit